MTNPNFCFDLTLPDHEWPAIFQISAKLTMAWGLGFSQELDWMGIVGLNKEGYFFKTRLRFESGNKLVTEISMKECKNIDECIAFVEDKFQSKFKGEAEKDGSKWEILSFDWALNEEGTQKGVIELLEDWECIKIVSKTKIPNEN